MNRIRDHELGKIVLYLVLTLLLGSLLTPWLFLAGKEIVREGWLADGPWVYVHGALDRTPFSRYFKRAIMIVALIGLFPLVRSLRFRSWRDLQIRRNPRALLDFSAGALLGAGFVLFMGAGSLYMGFFVREADAEWGVIPKLIATAITVGILEESLFRGGVLGVCLRKMSTRSAVVLTSAVFALIHFFKPPRLNVAESQVSWTTGFDMVALAFARLMDWQTVAAEFFTLLTLGILLAIVRMRTWSLWLPIGLHAGLVFGYQLFNKHTDDAPAIDQWVPWFGEDLKTGVIPLFVILVTGVLANLWIDLSRKPSPNAAADPFDQKL